MLSTIAWVPRGFASENPAAYADDDAQAMDGPEAAALRLQESREAAAGGAAAAAAAAEGAGDGDHDAMDTGGAPRALSPAPPELPAGAAAVQLSASSSRADAPRCLRPAPEDDDVAAKYNLQDYDQEEDGIAGPRPTAHTPPLLAAHAAPAPAQQCPCSARSAAPNPA